MLIGSYIRKGRARLEFFLNEIRVEKSMLEIDTTAKKILAFERSSQTTRTSGFISIDK
jgi:hypothetical protein